MKKKKLLFIMITVFLLIIIGFGAWLSTQKTNNVELLRNSKFKNTDESGIPQNWYWDTYFPNPEYSEGTCETVDGINVLHIVNHKANDARFAQDVSLKPDSTYCLQGMIRASAQEGCGANLSIAGVSAYSDSYFDTDGEWQTVQLYFRTGNQQELVTVFVRLGGYSGESIGEAWFADLSLHEVDVVPEDAFVFDLGLYDTTEETKLYIFSVHDSRIMLLGLYILTVIIMLIKLVHTDNRLAMCLLAVCCSAIFLVANQNAVRAEENTAVISFVSVSAVMAAVTMSISVWKLIRLIVDKQLNAPENEKAAENALHRKQKNRAAWVILCVSVAAYTILAFFHLGSNKAPQTSYVFSVDTEIVFDLGKDTDAFQMLFFPGINDKQYMTVEYSNEKINWQSAGTYSIDYDQIYQWMYVSDVSQSNSRQMSGRYVRVTGTNGLCMNEFLFRTPEGDPIKAVVLSDTAVNASALLDEPDTLEGEPGWYNSMYFDEIYHARTAYELLHGMSIFEISHPPLGKVIMSLGIAIFGMTPFGWRCMGALCGVLMLPGMFWLGKTLFKKNRYAFLSMLLMMLDTMHFTQTRIATIDSFVTLFIIWSYVFMLRWIQAEKGKSNWVGDYVWLFGSGIAIGLAIASKWTGVFAAIGLALLFFRGLCTKYVHLRRIHPLHKARANLLRLCIVCCIAFIVIPLVIYVLSFAPVYAHQGGVTISKVIEASRTMLWYHNRDGFGADHPFASPWYEWPLSQKPMYYADHSYTPAGYTFSIFAMGNYAVWWPAWIAVLAVVILWIRQTSAVALDTEKRVSLKYDGRLFLLIVMFSAQLLPWVFVPRGTYIYHYFPSVPFAILCICCIWEYITSWLSLRIKVKAERALTANRISLIGLIGYILLVLTMFTAFYPIAAGTLVPREWLDAINWFGNLYY